MPSVYRCPQRLEEGIGAPETEVLEGDNDMLHRNANTAVF